ncbi:MAG: GLUG motif-containing protein [Anaerohalosphaeraceae bacterium]
MMIHSKSITIVMVLLLTSFTYAASYGGGSGTAGDPYQIWTPEQMNTIGTSAADWGKQFKLMADIDMSAYTGTEYRIIGTGWDNAFTGTFDGGGHVIRNLTYTTAGSVNYVGVFGYTQNATIRNLGVDNATMEGHYYVGGLVGIHNSGTITACYAVGSISGHKDMIGGLVGFNGWAGTITGCYAGGAVSTTLYSFYVGGLVGKNDGTIKTCYATGSVSGESYVGGLVGYNSSGTLIGCYSAGFVSGTFPSETGGLVGHNSSSVSGCLWDMQTSGQSNGVGSGSSVGVVGKTTIEMQTMATFTDAGWDFTESDGDAADWWMTANHYPELAWEFPFGGGSGTAGDPYQIRTAKHMNAIGMYPGEWGKAYQLMADIDLSAYTGTQYNIIGNATAPFTGSFDGNGHVIRNLACSASKDYVGLFGSLESSALIENLGVENVTVSGLGIVGGLAGSNQGTILACHATGTVSGSLNVGGLAGRNTGTIHFCYAAVSVQAAEYTAGGLVGYNPGSLAGCYAMGAVSGPKWIGGLAGFCDGSITTCYATGSVSGTLEVGGLVGHLYGNLLTASFWDTQTSGTMDGVGNSDPDPSGAMGKTTPEMQTTSTFTDAGWDFSATDGDAADWWMPYQAYPRLGCDYVYGGGSGSPEDPYQIWTAQQMNAIGANPSDWTSHFKLMADIDMSVFSDTQYNIIGRDYYQSFTGTFNGDGHVLSNLTIAASLRSYVGLFGHLGTGGQIRNLGVEQVNINGNSAVGGLVGEVYSGTILSCYMTGTVNGAESNVGGLAGTNYSSIITSCHSEADVCGNGNVGGLVGNSFSGTITSCYATGEVNGSSAIGGLAGYNDYSAITTSYATGAVSGTYSVGGLVGYNNWASAITACYSAGAVNGIDQVGGFVGWDDAMTFTACFWDMQSSGYSNGVGLGTADGATGKITDTMKMLATYTSAGWDFIDETANGTADTWRMCADDVGYPKLTWQYGAGGDFACPDGVEVEDLEALAMVWLTEQGQAGYGIACDVNGDGRIDMADFEVLAGHWMMN